MPNLEYYSGYRLTTICGETDLRLESDDSLALGNLSSTDTTDICALLKGLNNGKPSWKNLHPNWDRDYLSTDEYITPYTFLKDLASAFDLEDFYPDPFPFLDELGEVYSCVNSLMKTRSNGKKALFVNPPYSGDNKAKAFYDAQQRMLDTETPSLILMPNTITEQGWFFDVLKDKFSNVYAVKKRISFHRYTPEYGKFKASSNRTGSLIIAVGLDTQLPSIVLCLNQAMDYNLLDTSTKFFKP